MTDGPFVTVGGRKAEPADVHGVLAALSRLWKLDDAQVGKIVYDNFSRALGQAGVPSGTSSGPAFSPA